MDDLEQRPDSFGFGRLFWATSEAIVVAELDTARIVLWNPAAERLFGYTSGEAVGMRLEELVPSELREQHLSGLLRYRTTGRSLLVGGPPVEVPAISREGERREVALTLTDMSDGDQRHVLAVIRDVTDQRRSERDLARMNDVMRSFVAAASHDLRTPLATVMGNAHVLREMGDLLSDEERDEALAAIARSGQQASRLVADLLTLSQIHAGALPMNAEPVDVHAAAVEAADSVGIAVDLPVRDGTAVLVDRDHLVRMLVNLLSNASRYGAPPYSISVAGANSAVAVAVADAGDGVPDDLRPRLFGAFERGHGRRGDSTGLGLSIVRGLAEANGGTVTYADAADHGAVFTITLPRSPDPASAAPTTDGPPAHSRLEG